MIFLLVIIIMQLSPLPRLVLVDFEFISTAGNRPVPVCLVAKDLQSGREWRLWQDQLMTMSRPPFPCGSDSCLVAYLASAELGCFQVLGWSFPSNILDLYAEFRCHTNGLVVPYGNSLLGALQYFGLSGITTTEKEEMRALILHGCPWSEAEKLSIIKYCESDLAALEQLLPKLMPLINIPQALLRGEYMKTVAVMEHNGIPIDLGTLKRLLSNRDRIITAIIADVDQAYGIFMDTTFSVRKFAEYLHHHDLPWPRLCSGNLALDDETFKTMVERYPQLEDLRVLRNTLAILRKNKLAVGTDGRNRCMLSPFSSKTGRNQPSNSMFIFGMPSWYRHLVRPPQGWGCGYADYSQQEFGIVAYLSRDRNMQLAYASGDPYIKFAALAHAVPACATKSTHPRQRELFKTCALAVLYGQGEHGLAQRTGLSIFEARELLNSHKAAFPDYWCWSDAIQDTAALTGRLTTALGWHCAWGQDFNPRSARNFPAQANGAEMLRLACIFAVESGVRLLAPVHDALVFEYRTEARTTAINAIRATMVKASAIVLGGAELRVDVETYDYPERFRGDKGTAMWERVCKILEGIDGTIS